MLLHSSKYVLVCFLHFIGVVTILKILCSVAPFCLISFLAYLANISASLLIAYYTFVFTKRKFLTEKVRPNGKAVLITGCDSGFGYNLAKRLDSKGFHVFACCLFPSGKGAQQLKDHCSEKLQIVPLDVTKDESVKEAFVFVKDNLGNLKLWAVVNNAGIQKGFASDFATLQDFKDTMEVNAFGVVRVTKAFLPFIKESKGRIVNLTSLHARVAAPYNTTYCMSKFAAGGFSDALRCEMDVWGIRVIQIEPELFKTALTDAEAVRKRVDIEIAALDPKLRQDYGDRYFEDFKTSLQLMLNKFGSTKIERVVDAMELAVSEEYPAMVYRPSRNDFIAAYFSMFELLPNGLKDLIIKMSFYIISLPKPIKA